jgi:hypothetical protein
MRDAVLQVTLSQVTAVSDDWQMAAISPVPATASPRTDIPMWRTASMAEVSWHTPKAGIINSAAMRSAAMQPVEVLRYKLVVRHLIAREVIVDSLTARTTWGGLPQSRRSPALFRRYDGYFSAFCRSRLLAAGDDPAPRRHSGNQ